MGDVPVMKEDAVACGVVEAGAAANARVPDVVDLDALRFERGLRGGDVGDAQREAARRQRFEFVAVRLRRHHSERHVAGLILDPVLVLRRSGRQAEDATVEVLRRLDVLDRDADVVDAFDLDHRGAYLRCSMNALPSGSRKNAMWHTPVSRISPSNATPRDSSSSRVCATSGTRSAMCAVCGALNCEPMFSSCRRYMLTFSPSWNSGKPPSDTCWRPSVSR